MNKISSINLLQTSNPERQKRDFLKVENECYLCGQDLDTHIEYIPMSHLVVEKAQCHSCMTLIRVKNHPLH